MAKSRTWLENDVCLHFVICLSATKQATRLRSSRRITHLDANGDYQVSPISQDVPGTQQRVERVLTLFRNLGTLDARIDFEHSFKAAPSRLYENRFLFGINRRALQGSRDERIISVAENIGMPHDLMAFFKRHFLRANHVYFGIEKNEHTLLFKAYLEFRDEAEKEVSDAQASGRSLTLFTGFKWDSFSPQQQAITQYAWHPSLPVTEIFQHLRKALDPSRHGVLMDAIEKITSRATQRIPFSDVQYLEVTEGGNPRRSFDINIYKSGLQFADISPYLLNVLRQYAIPPAMIESLQERISTERIGHLAGGVDRENKDFMTIYYGAKYIHSNQLAAATIISNDRPN